MEEKNPEKKPFQYVYLKKEYCFFQCKYAPVLLKGV